MSLIDRFNSMLNKPIQPNGEDTDPEDDSSLTLEEKRQLAVLRKDSMRRDLLEGGFGGINTGPGGLS